MLKRYIGDKAFYKNVIRIVLPIIVQNGITNLVSLLDNVMVGQLGTVAMSSVSTANQLLFVFNLCIFGASAGSGIFTAQFFGSKDHEGVRYTFRYKLYSCAFVGAAGISVMLLFGSQLIGLFLQGEGDPAVAEATLAGGLSYLRIMVVGLIPFAICNAYSSTLRETGNAVVPMIGGTAAVLVNLVLNYILIFGKFGAPAMGIEGAAWATVISRYVEFAIVAGWTHWNGKKLPYVRGVYRSLYIPWSLLKKITVKSLPLMFNESIWALGTTLLNQAYSTCGLDVVPALSIFTTLRQLVSVVFMSMGNAVGIIMGQTLGAGKSETEVRDTNRKLVTISVASGVVFAGIMAACSGVFPKLYDTDESIRNLATQLTCVYALIMPLYAYNHSAYFTLRSGGQVFITILFDSASIWFVSVPLTFLLSRFTDIAIIPLFVAGHVADIMKTFIGYYLIRKGIWIRNLTQK